MNVLLMPFLYFPDDKTEYIPAAFSFLFFMILMYFAIRWILNNSKKQALETKELEERILRERREAQEKQHSQH